MQKKKTSTAKSGFWKIQTESFFVLFLTDSAWWIVWLQRLVYFCICLLRVVSDKQFSMKKYSVVWKVTQTHAINKGASSPTLKVYSKKIKKNKILKTLVQCAHAVPKVVCVCVYKKTQWKELTHSTIFIVWSRPARWNVSWSPLDFFFFSHPSDGAMTKCLESGGKTLKVTGQTVCHVEGDQSDLRLQV